MAVYVGDLLTATAASVTGKPTPSRTWQWLRNGTAISGATSSTYTVVEADLGETLSVKQTETNIAGSAEATSLTVGPVETFTVASLFASGEEGAWYEPSPTTCFTDTAGTTPAAVGDPVARINDSSGNGNHATQGTAASRPTLEQTAGGLYYLDFDGVDDFMINDAFSVPRPVEVFTTYLTNDAAKTQVAVDTRNSSDRFYIGPNNGFNVFDTDPAAGDIRNALSAATPYVVSALGASPSGDDLRIDGVSVGTRTGGTHGFAGLTIGDIRNAVASGYKLDGNLYGLIVRGASSTTDEISNTEAYLAAKSGVTL